MSITSVPFMTVKERVVTEVTEVNLVGKIEMVLDMTHDYYYFDIVNAGVDYSLSDLFRKFSGRRVEINIKLSPDTQQGIKLND